MRTGYFWQGEPTHYTVCTLNQVNSTRPAQQWMLHSPNPKHFFNPRSIPQNCPTTCQASSLKPRAPSPEPQAAIATLTDLPMSNNDLLADLDAFYRGGSASGSGVTQSQPSHPVQPQTQPAQASQSQQHTQFQPTSDIFGFNSVAQTPQGGLAPETDGELLDDDDDDWGGFETAEAPAAPQDTPHSAPKPFNVAPVTSPVPTSSDPFAAFSVASSSPVPAPAAQLDLASSAWYGGEPAPSTKARPTPPPTSELMNNNLLDLEFSSGQPSTPSWSQRDTPPEKPSRKKPSQKDPNVLFDADDIDDFTSNEEDDEFGDFESVGHSNGDRPAITNTSRPTMVASPPSMDLLSRDEPFSAPEASISGAPQRPDPLLTNINTMSSPTSPYPSPLKSPAFQQRNPFPGLGVSTSLKEDLKKAEDPTSESPQTSWPEFEGDTGSAKGPRNEKWTPFEDSPVEERRKAASNPRAVATEEPDNWDWDEADVPVATTSQQPPPTLTSRDDYDDNEPPPTNIPPPSVLMTVLPELFSLANCSVFKPAAGQSAAARKKLMSDPATVSFLRAYLLIATVAARILAGRKLRWHRDKFLAQGMAISAAGAKGMKLAGVDKAQIAREDREAADVVVAWKEQVGRVRSAVAGANAAAPAESRAGPGLLRVPEITESMHVSTAKGVPSAPRQCVVCGLKREERVSKVDIEVEDSFGEWWVEHWGHRACKNFWKGHEQRLRQR
ncbi:uncharacterized protein DNG_03287 [Cephalotrichum gorgonifer]|uniref:Uncharacterized protein n=1 Tax=Cephalotrichum gorgonifer TaxID=2041049 RepID=A0AAE8SU42_9PEZI|nr:uncharacterized protein DNG_03287 [Cephalotrichum gorgonifer]